MYAKDVVSNSSRLQAEIKQTKPFGSVQEEAALSVLKTADLLHRAMERLLSGYGISPQQYNVMRILRGAGASGIPTLAIADRLIESTPGMTRLLDRMEEKQLARRERCRVDRRQVLCYSTPKTEQLLAELDPLVTELNRSCFASTHKTELKQLIETLERTRASTEAACAAFTGHNASQTTEG